MVQRFETTGDMLFSELSSETVCYDPSTGMQFKSGIDRVIGGTGRFAGATGQLQFEGTQWPLYVDAGRQGFALLRPSGPRTSPPLTAGAAQNSTWKRTGPSGSTR